MALQDRITALAQAVGADIKSVWAALAGKSDAAHAHTAAEVGLGNVENTNDANKPVSTAQQAALNTKLDKFTPVDARITSAGTSGAPAENLIARSSYEGINGFAGLYGVNTFINTVFNGLRLKFTDQVGTFRTAVEINTVGNVVVVGGSAFGYGAGSGGVVTQPTSKYTSVVLNKPCGRIVTHNQSMVAGTSVYFECSNSFVSPTDLGIAEIIGGGDPGRYTVRVLVGGGALGMLIKNISTSDLSEALTVQFIVFKGTAS